MRFMSEIDLAMLRAIDFQFSLWDSAIYEFS